MLIDVILADNLAAFGVLHRDFPFIERLGLVHGFDGSVGFFTILEEYVGETAWLFRRRVLNNVDIQDGSELGELFANIIFSGAARYTGNIDVTVILRVNRLTIDVLNYLLTTFLHRSLLNFIFFNLDLLLAQLVLIKLFRPLSLFLLVFALVLNFLINNSIESRNAIVIALLHSMVVAAALPRIIIIPL